MRDQSPTASSTRGTELTRDVLCGVILAAAFVLFASVSWRTWPDVLVDFGQELYVPWRLAAGEVLYREVAWVTGPLPQYTNALLFRLFGVSLTTIIGVNLIVLASITSALYYMLRQCGTRWSATVICLFFLAVFAFGQYSLIGNYNYVCPYRHDMTHGLGLGLINLLSLAQFGRNRRSMWLVASGLSLGLLSLVKVELLLAAGLTTVVALPVIAWQRRQQVNTKSATGGDNETRTSATSLIIDLAKWFCIVTAAAIVPMIVAVAALAVPLGWRDSFQHIFLQYRLLLSPELSASSGFYKAISGADHPTTNLIEMAFATFVVLAALSVGYVIELMFGDSKRPGVRAAVIGIASFCGGLTCVPSGEWHAISTSLPVLLVLVILLTVRGAVRDTSGRDTMLLLLAVYGIGLLPKILLRVGWAHYGFVLAMPGTLALMHVALQRIPDWWKTQDRSGHCFQAFSAGLLAACGTSLCLSWIRIDLAKTVPVGSNGDLFYGEARYDGRLIPTVKTLDFLRGTMQSDETLIVFPNGVMLNYQLRKRNPTPYIMFNPWESDVHGGENRIADSVIKAAPDYAVIVTMDQTIHGRGDFGRPEFGGRIYEFLEKQYDVVFQDVSRYGMEGLFSSTVFKRRPELK